VETHGDQVVYQFRVEGERADFHEVRLRDLTCACGLDWVRHPDNFTTIDDEGVIDGERWALMCDCGRVYYQYKLTESLFRETLRWLVEWNLAPAGRVVVGLYKYELFAGVGREDVTAPVPLHWDRLIWNARWVSEGEGLVATVQGALLLVWLAPDKASFEALARMMRYP
jgi:hypothetical protein